jgi:hypothetical protein
MPSIPRHQQFLAKAIDSIHKQQYPEGWDVFLHVDGNPQETLGKKLNRMIEHVISLGAEFVVLTDSDDLHHPTRVQRQVEPLQNNHNLLMTGTSQIVFRDTRNNEVWRYTGKSEMWIGGLTFAVGAWKSHRFEDLGAGVDTKWQKQFAPQARLDLQDDTLMLCSIHANNTSKKYTVGREWMQLPDVPDTLMELL